MIKNLEVTDWPRIQAVVTNPIAIHLTIVIGAQTFPILVSDANKTLKLIKPKRGDHKHRHAVDQWLCYLTLVQLSKTTSKLPNFIPA